MLTAGSKSRRGADWDAGYGRRAGTATGINLRSELEDALLDNNLAASVSRNWLQKWAATRQSELSGPLRHAKVTVAQALILDKQQRHRERYSPGPIRSKEVPTECQG